MNLILPPLPYAVDALEPYLSRRTLAAHFGRHHAGYVDRARRLIEGTPLQAAFIEEIVLASAAQADRRLFNTAAQVWNHTFYWSSMDPLGGGEAHGPIAALLEDSFGSQSAFRQQFIAAAADHFGSGWVWLVLDGERLQVEATSDAYTPLVGARTPLLTIDVWEHAYYLDHQHRRLDYISAFMAHLINWDFANRNLAAARERPRESQSRWSSAVRAGAATLPSPASASRR